MTIRKPMCFLGGLMAMQLGCAEAAPTRRDAYVGDDAPGADAAVSMVDAHNTVDAATATGARVVINELAPDGAPDFVELFNPSSTAFSLAGYFIADTDGLGEPPADPTHRVLLPAGATIPPGGFVVIAMNVDPPAGMTETPVGPVSPCPVAGVASCFQTAFGVGRTMETLALLTSDGREVARADYAGDLRGAEQSYCRVPDGTGDFAMCVSTPGAANTR